MGATHTSEQPSRVEQIQQLAEIERKLRGSTAPKNVSLRITSDSARIGFDTETFNESTRARYTAHICQEIASSEWEMIAVHDANRHYDEQADRDLCGSMVTVRLQEESR